MPRNLPTRLVTVLRSGCSLGLKCRKFSATSDRIIRPETGLSGRTKFQKVASLLPQVCVNFRFGFKSVVSYSYKSTKKKSEKKKRKEKCKRDTKEKEKCNIIVEKN